MVTRLVALPAAFALLLLTTGAMAQDVTVPEQRRGMSYEEYSSVRENMRLRMEKLREAEHKQEARSDNASEARKPDSAYGQGYHTRTRPDASTTERPERVERPQRIERFNRGDIMRR